MLPLVCRRWRDLWQGLQRRDLQSLGTRSFRSTIYGPGTHILPSTTRGRDGWCLQPTFASRTAQACIDWIPEWLLDRMLWSLLPIETAHMDRLATDMLPWCLQSLEPPRVALAALQLRCSTLSPAAHSALTRLTCLRHLDLTVLRPAAAGDVLLTPVATVVALTALTSLRLDLAVNDTGLQPGAGACFGQLTRLAALRQLDVRVRGRSCTRITLPVPAVFPALRRYAFLSCLRIQVGAVALAGCHL